MKTSAGKLGKTEVELLLAATRYDGWVHAQRGIGRGREGGKIDYGSRQRAAFCRLRDRGLVDNIQHSSQHESWRGWGVTTHDISGKLTDAGRAVVAELLAQGAKA